MKEGKIKNVDHSMNVQGAMMMMRMQQSRDHAMNQERRGQVKENREREGENGTRIS